jgi:ERCC4-type nuclease
MSLATNARVRCMYVKDEDQASSIAERLRKTVPRKTVLEEEGDQRVRLLSQVPGVSTKRARTLLDSSSVANIADSSV